MPTTYPISAAYTDGQVLSASNLILNYRKTPRIRIESIGYDLS